MKITSSAELVDNALKEIKTIQQMRLTFKNE